VRTAARLLPGAAVALLAACGSVVEPFGDRPETALVVDLPGFVPAAARPTPETLCDGIPTGTGATPPALSGALGTPAAVFYETARTTLEAYAWRASAEAARSFVDDATAASGPCDFQLFADADTDGDGDLDSGTSDVQSVEPWSGSGWEGLRIHRDAGSEQTDRRLVRADDVVLLVVLRADTSAPEDLAPLDDFLEAVAANLG
jgi:hypothetical protein